VLQTLQPLATQVQVSADAEVERVLDLGNTEVAAEIRRHRALADRVLAE
jgi:hypothetical protein